MSRRLYCRHPPEIIRRDHFRMTHCDGCGRQMPEGLYPRYQIDVERSDGPSYPEDCEWEHTFDACSAGCLTKVADKLREDTVDWPEDQHLTPYKWTPKFKS